MIISPALEVGAARYAALMLTALEVTLIYLAAAVGGVALFRSLQLPAMLGYLVMGVIIGPHALGLSGDSKQMQYLGEFGVVFLMFTIGLEFSLTQLKAMRQHVLGLGFAQVLLTMLGTLIGGALIALIAPQFGISWQATVALGGALAMSSTAIVIKLLSESLQLDTEHGRRILGVLLFQDLAVVPLIVLIPALARPANELAPALVFALLKAALVLIVLLSVGQKVMHMWLHTVAKRKSQELFVLNVLFIALLLAYATEHMGLSLALGAFVAGMLISETPFKHQVDADIKPFREVLLGLFFITIGMLLDWRVLMAHWPLIIALTVLPVLFKFGLVWALARGFKASNSVSLRTALGLAQAGEFGFVLLNLASQSSLIPQDILNPVLASMVISMCATPFILGASDKIVLKLSGNEWMMQSLALTTLATKSIAVEQHVLILGYGRVGQNLARMLEAEKVPYMAIDNDPDRVRAALAGGDNISFGDATRSEALAAAGINRARVVAITFLGPEVAMKILAAIQTVAPNKPVVVRTQDDTHLEKMRAAGATEVVPESIEGSLMLASHALALAGVPMRRVLRDVQNARNDRYELLRGYFHGASDDTEEEQAHDRLMSVNISSGSRWEGRQISALQLDEMYVSVNLLKRGTGAQTMRIDRPGDEERMQAGDTLVLKGKADGLAKAEELFLPN
jgi:monovalent cation:H+ antiporter-2, CPA2 family